MPFIIPSKRQSVISKRFSHYETVEQSQHFMLQKRKAVFYADANRPPCRIITTHSPFYEVAYGDDLEEMKQNEWRYIIQQLPKLLPTHLVDKYLRKWLRAHFTQVAVENIENIEHGKDGTPGKSDEKNFGGGSEESEEDNREDNREEKGDSLSSPSGRVRDLLPSDAHDDADVKLIEAIAKRTFHREAATLTPKKDESQQPVMNTIPLRGKLVFFTLCLLCNLLWLLLRDASPNTFFFSVASLNFLMFLIILRRQSVVFELVIRLTEKPVSKSAPTSFVSSNASAGATSNRVSRQSRNVDRKAPAAPRRDPAALTAGEGGGAGGAGGGQGGGSGGGETTNSSQSFAADGKEVSPSFPESDGGTDVEPGAENNENKEGEDTSASGVPPSRKLIFGRPRSLEAESWGDTKATYFDVRCPPNYAWNKFKAPSKEALFELTAVDLFKYDKKVDHIAQRIHVPYEAKDNGGAVAGVPPVFIVNFQIPANKPEPTLWGGASAKADEGFSIIMFFTMTEKTRKTLQDPPKDAAPCFDLLKRFMDACRKGEPLKGRLKAIPKICNPQDVELGVFLKTMLDKYNAKPFLTGPKYHTFYQGPNYIEVDVDIHRYQFMARKVVGEFMPLLKSCVFDLGVVVEGQGDEEQPEQMLGCCRFFKIDPAVAKTVEDVYPTSSSSSSSSSSPST